MLGYSEPLYILPFDHKTSFITKLFGFDYDVLTDEQRNLVEQTRAIVYSGFEKAIALGIPKEHAAFLTDEEFGDRQLQNAKEKGYITILTVEKSGQKEFSFQYEDFATHIQKYQPTFVKALVRYNAEDDREVNKRQLQTLKTLSDFAHEKGYKFLIEPLVPATEAQLQKLENDQKRYEQELRPSLTVQMIGEFQEASVEPDVWKLEGFEKSSDYEKVVAKAKFGERKEVSVVVLGRAGSRETVDQWLIAGAVVEGVTGFAVGRTVFYTPIEKWYKKEITQEEAVSEIAQNFFHFYTVFTQAKSKKSLLS